MGLKGITIGKTYPTNHSGTLRVLGVIDCFNVRVRFIDTGYRTTACAGHIQEGVVKDLLKPTLSGVGYLGAGPHKTRMQGKPNPAYRRWAKMLERCYTHKRTRKNASYVGCKVCPDWHNFQTFATWHEANYKEGLHIDKDILGTGKLYSPETCKFVTVAENVAEACAKHWRFISPVGLLVKIYNLNKFCQSRGLDNSAMCKVHSGKINQHKGWTGA